VRLLVVLTAILAAVAIAAPIPDADALVAEPNGNAASWMTGLGADFKRDESRIEILKHRLRVMHHNSPHLLKMAVKFIKIKARKWTAGLRAAKNNLKAVTKGQQLMKTQVSKREAQVTKLKAALAKTKKGTSAQSKVEKQLHTATQRLARKVKEKKDGLISVKAANRRIKKDNGRLTEVQTDFARFKAQEDTAGRAVKATKDELKILRKSLQAIEQGRSSYARKKLASARRTEKAVWREEIRTARIESKTLKEARKAAANAPATDTIAAHDEAKHARAIKQDVHSWETVEHSAHREVTRYKEKVNRNKKNFAKAAKTVQKKVWDFYKKREQDKANAAKDKKEEA